MINVLFQKHPKFELNSSGMTKRAMIIFHSSTKKNKMSASADAGLSASAGDERDGWVVESWAIEEVAKHTDKYVRKSRKKFVDLGEARRELLERYESIVSEQLSDCSETDEDESEGSGVSRWKLKDRKNKDKIEAWNGMDLIEIQSAEDAWLEEPFGKVAAWPVTLKAKLKWKCIHLGHRNLTKSASKPG